MHHSEGSHLFFFSSFFHFSFLYLLILVTNKQQQHSHTFNIKKIFFIIKKSKLMNDLVILHRHGIFLSQIH